MITPEFPSHTNPIHSCHKIVDPKATFTGKIAQRSFPIISYHGSLGLLIVCYILASLPRTIAAGLDTWNQRSSGASVQLSDIAYGAGIFVVVGDSGTILTSSDGATWFPRNSGTSYHLGGITFGNGLFVAVGGRGFPIRSTVLTSGDGVE